MNLFTGINQRLTSALRNRPNQFIQRLEEQATLLVASAEALAIYMKKPGKKKAQEVTRLEKEADEVRRILIDELNRSFVTPIDREDLFSLSHMLDNVIDAIDTITGDMDALKVKPNETLQRMTNMLHEASQEILLAIQRLEHHPNVATTHVLRLKSIGNDIEALYSDALAKLYEQDVKDIHAMMEVLKLRDVYRSVKQAGNSAVETGNLISHVVVKFY
jgi:predicted phosphate transport protein (TIGR00153 family)